ncbi:MAG: molybdenum cofactor guanylyltransferase [Methanosarcinales archaeon]|nr:molybdenum cofactor guanylyltransferase [Methanosarcinales archaeon]
MRSALILAGGRGRRLGYKEKALIPIKGRTILEYNLDLLERLVDEVIISVRDDEQKCILVEYTGDRAIIEDHYTDVGPLAGILEGLKVAEGEYIFITACDMPFLNPEVVEMLFQRAYGHDAAIPVWENEILEPLHAVYRTRPMAIETEKAIKNGDKIALAPVFRLKDVVFVDMEGVRALDPGLRTFININTLEDMELIEE